LGPWGDVSGWFASQIAAPLVRALTPALVGDWVTDRVARRPSGRQARATYRDPLYHYPNFQVILEELALTPNDVFLDVGCGGGALLHECLKSGCRAAGVDHSPEMVEVARELNQAAVAEGRVQIVHGRADQLPFEADTFTCAAMTGVLGFLPDPVTCLGRIRAVLKPGGRFVMLGSDARLRGTPAAPKPIASRLRFYEDEDLVNMGRAAGFDHAVVIRCDLSSYARAVGVPEEHIELFEGLTSFLVARKD
jgi:SAM-dependent methyltransferase